MKPRHSLVPRTRCPLTANIRSRGGLKAPRHRNATLTPEHRTIPRVRTDGGSREDSNSLALLQEQSRRQLGAACGPRAPCWALGSKQVSWGRGLCPRVHFATIHPHGRDLSSNSHGVPDSLAFLRQGRRQIPDEGTDCSHTHWHKQEFNHSRRVRVIRLKWPPVAAAPTVPLPKTAFIFIVGKGWPCI